MVNDSFMGLGFSARHLRSRTASTVRVGLEVLAYPASILLVWRLLSDGHLSAGATIVLLAAPGVVFGAVVSRWWILAVPPVGIATWLMINAGCANSCGEDTATTVALMEALYVVLPAMVALLVGLCAGRSLGYLVRLALRRGSAAPIHDDANSPQADRA
jgi:hypothetical protein